MNKKYFTEKNIEFENVYLLNYKKLTSIAIALVPEYVDIVHDFYVNKIHKIYDKWNNLTIYTSFINFIIDYLKNKKNNLCKINNNILVEENDKEQIENENRRIEKIKKFLTQEEYDFLIQTYQQVGGKNNQIRTRRSRILTKIKINMKIKVKKVSICDKDKNFIKSINKDKIYNLKDLNILRRKFRTIYKHELFFEYVEI